MSMAATAEKSRTPPSVMMAAAPRTWARRARMSPMVPVPFSPRASITRISPSLTESMACFWALKPPPWVLKRSSRLGT